MSKCAKCGFENSDDAVFCENCGSKIESKNVCPCCGEELPASSKFCKKCGCKINDETLNSKPVESPKDDAKVNKKDNKDLFVKILNIVLNSIFIFFIAMMLIAVWGDFSKVSNSSISNGVSYWFSDGWKLFENESASMIPSKVNFIIGFATFVCCAICIYVFGIIGIIKSSKNLIKKCEPDSANKYVSLTALFSTFYFVFIKTMTSSTITQTYSSYGLKYSVSVAYGWGGILYIVSLAILIAAILARKIILAIKIDKNYFSLVKDCSLFIFIILFVLIGFGEMFGIVSSSTYYDSSTALFSPFALFELFASYMSTNNFPTASFVMTIISMVFIIGALIFGALSIGSIISNEKQNNDKVKIFFPASLGLYILSFIFGLVGTSLYINFGSYEGCSIAPAANAIVAIVFAILGIVLYFVFRKLSNNNKIEQQ